MATLIRTVTQPPTPRARRVRGIGSGGRRRRVLRPSAWPARIDSIRQMCKRFNAFLQSVTSKGLAAADVAARLDPQGRRRFLLPLHSLMPAPRLAARPRAAGRPWLRGSRAQSRLRPVPHTAVRKGGPGRRRPGRGPTREGAGSNRRHGMACCFSLLAGAVRGRKPGACRRHGTLDAIGNAGDRGRTEAGACRRHGTLDAMETQGTEAAGDGGRSRAEALFLNEF